MKKNNYQSPSGMHDILPEDQKYFKRIYDIINEIADFYGFGKIDTPMLEDADLFSRGVGESTDIVKKEMFTLKTKGGDSLALRPEWTTPIARAYIEHGMHNRPQPLKLWHFGPCFRYERPQAGRYRQFWQFGFEVLGDKSPIIDAQIIQIFYNVLKELKIKNLFVEINSIGDSECRGYYKKLLSGYLKKRDSSLCSDCKRRVKDNVLRVLDCKNEGCNQVKADAPQILNHLCDECKVHFKEVLEFLDELETPYSLNPYLVRGLDYYTKTVFEIFSEEQKEEESLEKRLSLAGGGRYDKLVKLLKGKETPACGAAGGIERIVELMKISDKGEEKEGECHIFLAQLGSLAKRKGLKIMEEFRKAKIKVAESFGKDSLRVQLSRAGKVKAKYTLIIGQKEALDDSVIIRNMETGKQEEAKLDEIVSEIKKRLKNK